jgi:hypothetical protein
MRKEIPVDIVEPVSQSKLVRLTTYIRSVEAAMMKDPIFSYLVGHVTGARAKSRNKNTSTSESNK